MVFLWGRRKTKQWKGMPWRRRGLETWKDLKTGPVDRWDWWDLESQLGLISVWVRGSKEGHKEEKTLLTGASSEQKQRGPLAGHTGAVGGQGRGTGATRLEKQQGEQGKCQKRRESQGMAEEHHLCLYTLLWPDSWPLPAVLGPLFKRPLKAYLLVSWLVSWEL